MKKLFIVLLAAVIASIGVYILFDTSNKPQSRQKSPDYWRQQVETVAGNLDTPWAIAVMPDNKILVTERSGTVSILGQNGTKIAVADVVEQGEGGLLGLALHPEYNTNKRLYIYKSNGQNNTVERYRLLGNKLVEQRVIVGDIPAANVHNGGEIKFGPDGKLYITTGDAATESSAQDKTSLAGKIIRINEDGSIPSDNPFGTGVWSYGHRNPQGLAWDDLQRLWSTEHGPSGQRSGFDELNLIEKGGNYGWPLVHGDEKQDGLVAPVLQSGANETWAPAGLAYAGGSLYFTGLRGQSLYRAKITGDNVSLSSYFAGDYGRLRAITVSGTDLLVSTSNHDGRGTPAAQDDRILRVNTGVLN